MLPGDAVGNAVIVDKAYVMSDFIFPGLNLKVSWIHRFNPTDFKKY